MIWMLGLSLLAYAWLVLRRWVVWLMMPSAGAPQGYEPKTRLSVIIPVRNEAANIPLLLRDLEAQNYPKNLFEVLIVDDNSIDDTVEVVHEVSSGSTMSINVLRLSELKGVSMKKGAVKHGVEKATGELLVFTDGDCRVGPEWLMQYAYTYEQKSPYFISGPVCFQNTESSFEQMQLVEFSSLIGIGGASLALEKPNMCNGANLAYTKEVFYKVGGFAGNEQVASGDDEFLLHKVHKHFPGKAVFLKNDKAIVYTDACKTLSSFVQQRLRWASKWRSYQSFNVQMVALVVFFVNLLLFLSIPLFFLGEMPLLVLVAGYVTKFSIDFLFLERILSFLGRRRYLWQMLPLQLLYVPYVVFTGLLGLLGKYQWKGRSI